MIIDNFHKIFGQIITKNHFKIMDSSTSGACKKIFSPPRFICYFFDPKRTNSDPIPIIFRFKKTYFFDLGQFLFQSFAISFSSFFAIFIYFQPRKGGSNRFPASLRFYWYFFHPKRTKFHKIWTTSSLCAIQVDFIFDVSPSVFLHFSHLGTPRRVQ